MNEAVETLAGFHRRLTLRLAVAGVLASLLAGVAAFFIETERLDETLVDQAAIEAHNLGPMVAPNAGRGEIDALLSEFLMTHTATSRDFFVVAELYDNSRKGIGEAALPDFGYVEDSFDRSDHQFPPPGNTWYKKTVIRGGPFLQVMVALKGRDGSPQGWFEGIYRLSPSTLEGIRTDILQITALVVGAVLLTALILHPLMASLQGHVVKTAQDLLRANIDTLKVLGSAIAKRDSDTNAHNFRVTVYAVRIAEAMELSDGAIRSLIKGAFLHDVGKIAIPDAILLKPGKLDDAEYMEMKTHVAHGLDIIAASNWLKDAAEVVGGHHEKVDGSGYPNSSSGDAIPLGARIFAVADVFDALTSERPYKKPMTVERTLAILEEGRDTHFDGLVLDRFREIVERVHSEVAALDDAAVERLAETVIGRYFVIAPRR